MNTEETTQPIEAEPIFIIGAARSGTSILAYALLKGAKIPGFNEGHFIPIIHPLTNTARDYFLEQRLRDSSLDVTMAKLTLEDLMNDIMDMVKKRQESFFPNQKVWLDKTPDGAMLQALPYIIKMWPKARFIYAKRRSLENISSRLKKFTYGTFEMHCNWWKGCMTLWKNRKAILHPEQWIEVEQREIALQPEVTAKQIGEFLKLTPEQTDAIATIFKNQRVEYRGGNEKKPLTLETTGWTAEEIEIYKRVCSETNKEMRYSEDESYYLIQS